MAIFGYVALGGALGAMVRYALQSGLLLVIPWYPLGTAIANLLGSFLAGFVYGAFHSMSLPYKAFILTGFLGALTTLSAFSLEVVLQLEDKRHGLALAHWVGGAVFCVLLCYAGLRLGYKLNQ